MSTLFESLKIFENSHDRWRPYGEALIPLGERGVLVSALAPQIDLARQVNSTEIRETITAVADHFLRLLEWDRNKFQEGWERLSSACYECKIDLSGKYRDGAEISGEEVDQLFHSVLELKNCASKAEVLWEKLSNSGDSFSSLDLATRHVYMIAAKNEEFPEHTYASWVKEIPKSIEINDFKQWPHPR